MKCKNCEVNDAIKYSKYSNGEFCSKKCARSYSSKEKRNEINIKVSNKLKGKSQKKRILTEDEIKEFKINLRKYWDNKILNTDFNLLGIDSKRKRVILEQKNKCNKCGLDKWLNFDIILELEHIDGNHHNNDRNNLEALCPNCHSLTPTWRGRNKKDNKTKVSDEKLLNALIKYDFNIRQALISVNLAAKGRNYARCYKLKKEYENIIN